MRREMERRNRTQRHELTNTDGMMGDHHVEVRLLSWPEIGQPKRCLCDLCDCDAPI